MKKIEWLLALLLLIGFFSVIFYHMNMANKRGEKFLASRFRKEIAYIEQQNKHDCIHFNDGTEVKLSLDFSDIRMKRFYGRHFNEFLFKGDSVIKEKNESYLLIKPLNGEEFKLFY